MASLTITPGRVSDHDYADDAIVSELAYNLMIAVSSARILGQLDYSEYSSELLAISKALAGEIALLLYTGHYVDGLASELSEAINYAWVNTYDDLEFLELLHRAIELKQLIDKNAASSRHALDLLNLMTRVFGINLSHSGSTLLSKIYRNPEPRLVLQMFCTALVIALGGLSEGGGKVVQD